MKETIIYSNVLNETMYLRTSSLLGKDRFLCRLFSFTDLVKDANDKLDKLGEYSLLIPHIGEVFISNLFAKNPLYKVNSYVDVAHYKNSLFDIRKELVSENEYEEFLSNFSDEYEENETFQKLSAFYKDYLLFLDDYSYEDDISLARKLLGSGPVYDEIYYFKEEHLSLLEKELLRDLSKSVKEISYFDLYPIKEIKNEVKDITPFYGNLSEVDGVLSNILKNNYSFKDVLIVLPGSNEYPSLFYEKMLNDKIPFTFESGIRISSSDAFRLYKQLKDLDDVYNFGVDGFKALFKGGLFDTSKFVNDPTEIDNLCEILGRLKVAYNDDNELVKKDFEYLNNNKKEFLKEFITKIDIRIDVEKMISYVYHVIEEFSEGIDGLVFDYLKEKEGKTQIEKEIDEVVKGFISEFYFRASKIVDPYIRRTYLDLIDEKFIYQKTFNGESIHVTTLSRAINTVRKHVYFVGFDASSFPGRVMEDYLFNDEWVMLLTKEVAKSERLIKDKNNLFKELITIYSSLGSDIHLSYSLMNINEVAENNPCSVLLDYIETRGENYLKNQIKKCRYFSNPYSSLNKAVDQYIDNSSVILKGIPEFNEYDDADLLRKFYSPSAISLFFECPLRFYVEKVRHLSKDKEFDIFNSFEANTFGNIVHLALEHLDNNSISKEQFLVYAEDLFDSYLKFNRPLLSQASTKQDYMLALSNAYDYLKQFDLDVSFHEYKISREDFLKVDNILFNGSVDLLTKTKDGEYIVLDYKTGKHIRHDNKDTQSVLQAIIYALLIEQKLGIKINKVIYFYTQTATPVEISVNEHIKKTHELLNDFKVALKAKQFTPKEDLKERREACKFCPLKDGICKYAA